jgi:hypothetical protein
MNNRPLASTEKTSSHRAMVVGRLLVCLLALAGSVTAMADDIALQVGQRFSLYAPPNCRRLEQAGFALVLDCNFRGKTVLFYLKEFPGQLGVEFDPRKNPPTRLHQDAYLNTALQTIVDELDTVTSERMKFFSHGSSTGDDVDALFWQEGYLSSGKDLKDFEHVAKCVFLRVQTYRRGLSAVLFAVSDVDGPSHDNGPLKCLGLPGEVQTILGSLGGNFEGGRFMRSP